MVELKTLSAILSPYNKLYDALQVIYTKFYLSYVIEFGQTQYYLVYNNIHFKFSINKRKNPKQITIMFLVKLDDKLSEWQTPYAPT